MSEIGFNVIFGAGELGAEASLVVDNPICFCDNNPAKQDKQFCGLWVRSFDYVRQEYPDATIIIAADRWHDEILEQVSPYYDKIYRFVRELPADKLYIRQLNVVVTEKCTLKCKGCSSLMPLYKKPKHVDTNILLTSLHHIMEAVDGLLRVEVLGGEPFLNKDMPIIMDYLIRSKVGKIDVITNGTVVPKDVMYLKDPKVCVVINDYTGKSKLAPRLSMAGVNYKQNLHLKWADLGNFKPRQRYIEEARALFAKCNFRNCSELLHGKIYRCPRSSHGTNLGLIPDDFPWDSTEAYDTTVDTLRENLKGLLSVKYLYACDYCNGNTRDTLVLEPGK